MTDATAVGVGEGTNIEVSSCWRGSKRKEWTRRLDVEGNLFWYRQNHDSSETGYVAQLQASKGDEEQEDGDAAAAVVDRQARVSKTSLLPRAGAKLTLVEASAADPATFPTGISALSHASVAQKKEAVEFAASDFPTKYAQFVVTTASLILPAEIEFLKLSVHRDYMLEESLDHMCCIQPKNIRSFMRINFLDESGVDAGGVHREWFMLLNELLVNPTLRLFVCTNRGEGAFYFNPRSREDVGEDHLRFYFSTGRLVGRALLEGGIWGFHLARPLLKLMLGVPVTFSDVEYFDPETYKHLTWMLQHDGADALGLDFTVTERSAAGELHVVELVPGGQSIDVTDANKREYADRWFKHMLFESVGDQLHAFLSGVYEVVPPEQLLAFDPEEFDYVLCGTPEIDVVDWRAHSTHSPNLNSANALRWFWEVVADMPNEYRRRLLLFATGSACVPISGFAGLTSYDGRLCPFNLRGVPYTTTQYISSHACFNRLDLPLYRSKSELQTVLLATLETDLTGFTTA